MRITESRIRQIIREEFERELGPEKFDPGNPEHRSAMRRHFKSDREDRPSRPSSGHSLFPGMDDDDIEPEPIPRMRFDQGRGSRDDLDEAISLEKSTSPREKLESYLMDSGGGELVDAVMSAVDSALKRAMDKGDEAPTSEDVTFNLSDEMLDMIPDEDEWHEMLDAVLEDEFDSDAFEESEADRESEEETRRDLSHPSNFIPSRRSRY